MTSQAPQLPSTGYLLERVYFPSLSLSVRAPTNPTQSEGQILFGWDWQVLGNNRFEVSLQLGLDPVVARNEEVRAVVTGRFVQGSGEVTVPLERFAQFHAPAILMPYAREAISSLTSRGFFGPVQLPPVNILKLMEEQDPSATKGFAQLRGGNPPSRELGSGRAGK